MDRWLEFTRTGETRCCIHVRWILSRCPLRSRQKGSAELRELHKFFHESVGGLYCKLVASHVSGGHGTIEWLFGGTDVGVYKTGKPFEVPGVSVIEVRQGRISRNLDYYDAATIMKQVGLLPVKQ